jgi:SAM-dependent methyltransferase
VDKAGRVYWDTVWRTFPAPNAFDPNRRGCAYQLDREFARLFADALEGLPADCVTLEAGAADSSVLPYFAKLGHRIIGVDYSEIGCERLRRRLGAVPGEVMCCDIFNPPASVLHSADLVLSIGLVEHFTDTSNCIAALANFIRPGGRLLTIIPNMQGSVGLLQRLIAPSVYKVHVPLSQAICVKRTNEGWGSSGRVPDGDELRRNQHNEPGAVSWRTRCAGLPPQASRLPKLSTCWTNICGGCHGAKHSHLLRCLSIGGGERQAVLPRPSLGRCSLIRAITLQM